MLTVSPTLAAEPTLKSSPAKQRQRALSGTPVAAVFPKHMMLATS